jgi:hypothetical protein
MGAAFTNAVLHNLSTIALYSWLMSQSQKV